MTIRDSNSPRHAVGYNPPPSGRLRSSIVLQGRSMETEFFDWLDQQQGRQYDLHTEHVNPAFVKMLRTIGFDKAYVRGEGCYLWDAEGNRYLDLLTGWGVFALGRNHPKVRAILENLMARNLPNLVRMDC